MTRTTTFDTLEAMPAHSKTLLATCLTGPKDDKCSLAASCPRRLPRSCLVTPIPSYTPLATIECCFRCCLQHWTRRLGLDENLEHWRKQNVNFWVSTGAGTLSAELAVEPLKAVALKPGWEVAQNSMLYARFSMARYAHVQAIQWADWIALADSVGSEASELPAAIAAPSARRAKATLIVLNGWGNGPENVSADGSHLTHRIAIRRVGHAGGRMIFDDPLKWLTDRLHPNATHAVNYGNDHTLSEPLIRGFYKQQLGVRLARYLAPNLQAQATQLPYAMQAPLGLNSNGRALELLLQSSAGAKLHTRHEHRQRELLCCCMTLWIKHRVRIVRLLEGNGFVCDHNQSIPWEQTIERYMRARFVLAVWGNGHQDFRMWEALAAGAVPVVQRFAEQDALFEGLPVVRVDDWATFTPAKLDEEWDRILEGVREGRITWTKAFLPYWFAQHTAHLEPTQGSPLL